MAHEPQTHSDRTVEEGLASLRGCLVEGDAEQCSRERRVRRRALVLSILLQSAALTVLVLVPLFGKTERIAQREWIPIPPYGHPHSQARSNTKPSTDHHLNHGGGLVFQRPTQRPIRPTPGEDDSIGPPAFNSDENAVGPACNWCVLLDKNSGLRPPQPSVDTQQRPKIVRITTLNPAMLIHRVEPIYPPLARQLRREGRVELRAIIGTDGTIQSLQVVSGDPLFLLSAQEAVAQWRYKPTVLNGQPVRSIPTSP